MYVFPMTIIEKQQQDHKRQQQQTSASPLPLPLLLVNDTRTTTGTCTTMISSLSSSSVSSASSITSSSSLSLLLDTLPNEAIGLIIKHACSDMTSIMNLATISDTIRIAIYDQQLLHCDRCSISLFSNNSLSISTAFTPHTKAFICATCHGKLCGYTLFDYDRKKCKPHRCDGCGKIECQRCMDAHLNNDDNVDGYGTENYCENCQDEFEFGMGGC